MSEATPFINVIYREVVVIDGREYTFHSSDYSSEVGAALSSGLIEEGDNDGIIDFVNDIVANG